jgi:hypothetical protein
MIRRTRIVCLVATVVCAAAGVAFFSLLDSEARPAYMRLAIVAVVVLVEWNLAGGDIETQIRHLNDLSLAPWESERMNMQRVVLMWIGDALMGAAFFGLAVSFLLWSGDDYPGSAIAVFVALTASGFITRLYANFFSDLFSSRYARYNPEEDEWQDLWWSWRDR